MTDHFGRVVVRSRGIVLTLLCTLAAASVAAPAAEPDRFMPDHVFELEWTDDPRVSPDGSAVVYVRMGMDRQRDRRVGSLWIHDLEAGTHEPLVTGKESYSSPRFSPDGGRLAYLAVGSDGPALMIRHLGSGRSFRVAALQEAPRQLSWSPDGTRIAFKMFVPDTPMKLAQRSAQKPEGAECAPSVKVIDDLVFRFDGRGYLRKGASHVHLVPAEGGTPRAVTSGPNDFGSPVWSTDGRILYVVGNDVPDAALDPIESEIYAVDVESGERRALTDRDGPDRSPAVAPDGRRLAWQGYDDGRLMYQQPELRVRDLASGRTRDLSLDFHHALSAPIWTPDGRSLLALASVEGETHLVRIDLDGSISVLARHVGGLSVGRPYGSGAFHVAGSGRGTIAYTRGTAARPAHVALLRGNGAPAVLADLNDDVLGRLELARIEALTVLSRHDGLPVDAWMALPPGFEADGTAPMILEIHGGPNAMYGPQFAAEIQRYAAEGYVVVYANPRGSTGYGEAFALEIDRAYPGHDHDDLMSVVDAVVQRGYVNPDRLFVTGGSGGGVLSAYATGRTDRFAAAAVVKPVINWLTTALAGDIGQFIRRHWIRRDPWAEPMEYLDRSPLSVVGNVATPTLVMVGEEDWRTPAWEAEQWYRSLKMRGIETVYVRVPGASHSIAARPSHLIAKVENILGWFARYDPEHDETEPRRQ